MRTVKRYILRLARPLENHINTVLVLSTAASETESYCPDIRATVLLILSRNSRLQVV